MSPPPATALVWMGGKHGWVTMPAVLAPPLAPEPTPREFADSPTGYLAEKDWGAVLDDINAGRELDARHA